MSNKGGALVSLPGEALMKIFVGSKWTPEAVYDAVTTFIAELVRCLMKYVTPTLTSSLLNAIYI